MTEHAGVQPVKVEKLRPVEGDDTTEYETAFAVPESKFAIIVLVTDDPWVTDTLPDEFDSEKSIGGGGGGGGGVTVVADVGGGGGGGDTAALTV